jgi:hypothetical protein
MWIGFSKDGTEIKMMASVGATTVLKARFSSTPARPRAFQWLLEALALWEGEPVRAVVCVDGVDDISDWPLLRDWFPDFGSPLYTILWTDRQSSRKRRDEITGLGDFRDLKQHQHFESLESMR